jgi:hypothetical protein
LNALISSPYSSGKSLFQVWDEWDTNFTSTVLLKIMMQLVAHQKQVPLSCCLNVGGLNVGSQEREYIWLTLSDVSDLSSSLTTDSAWRYHHVFPFDRGYVN